MYNEKDQNIWSHGTSSPMRRLAIGLTLHHAYTQKNMHDMQQTCLQSCGDPIYGNMMATECINIIVPNFGLHCVIYSHFKKICYHIGELQHVL